MKHLILDCGGVLVYPRLGDWQLPFGIVEVLGRRAQDIHSSRYLLAQRQAAHWLDESRLVGNVEEERQLRREYLREIDVRMDWHMTFQEIERLTDDFTDNIRRYGLFDDVDPWLKRWQQRYSLGILSDAMPSILVFLRRFGILERFDAAVISTQVGAIKPDARMYAAILKALKAEPGDCLFVDDKAENLDGAVDAGMQAVQMARPAFLPAVRWDGPSVRGFEELNTFMERQEARLDPVSR